MSKYSEFTDVTANAIGHALQTPDLMTYLIDEYFKSISTAKTGE